MTRAAISTIGLLLGSLFMLELGRRLGGRYARRFPSVAPAGTGAVEAALFGLMALILAFTFNGAASRFDGRRALIVEEANAIGTAWLRLDLLPEDAQPPLRDDFRAYLDSRLAVYRKIPDLGAVHAELDRSAGLQRQIWRGAVAGCNRPHLSPSVCGLLLPSLNTMIDLTTTRTMAAFIHPPTIIYILLFGLGLGCSLLAGYAMAGSPNRRWLHILSLSIITALTFYVILDLEYPRLGFLRVNDFDRVLIDLRSTIS